MDDARITELALRAREGDRAAAGEFVALTQHQIWRLLVHLSDRRALELVTEALNVVPAEEEPVQEERRGRDKLTVPLDGLGLRAGQDPLASPAIQREQRPFFSKHKTSKSLVNVHEAGNGGADEVDVALGAAVQ